MSTVRPQAMHYAREIAHSSNLPRIDTEIPIPPRKFAVGCAHDVLRKTLAKLRPGKDSFVWTNNWNPYVAAKQIGVRITTRKLNGTGYRVWRKK